MPRGKHGHHKRGSEHPRWNHGKLLSSDGYFKLRVGVRHPLADPNGYAYEHLIVWASAGNPLPGAGEVLHHKNHNKQDNRIENLTIATRSEHNSHHNEMRVRDELGRFVTAGRLLDGQEWNQYPETK